MTENQMCELYELRRKLENGVDQLKISDEQFFKRINKLIKRRKKIVNG